MAPDMLHQSFRKGLEATRYYVDFISGILLLTGQITNTGVFVVEEGFYLSATGPILGGVRFQGKTAGATATLDIIDIIAAFLLIIDAIRVTGVYVSSSRSYLVFSGPIFGITGVPTARDPFAPPPLPTTAESKQLSQFVKKTMLERL